ncbi:unnamed protein product [Urochloa humidicola]
MRSRCSRPPAAADCIEEPIDQVIPDTMDMITEDSIAELPRDNTNKANEVVPKTMDVIVEDSFDDFRVDNTDQEGEMAPKTMDLIVEDSFDEFPGDNTNQASEMVPKAMEQIVEDSFDQVHGDNNILAIKDSVGEVVMDTMDQMIEDSELYGEDSLAEWVTDSLEGESNKREEEEPEADFNTLLYDRYEAAMKEVIEERSAIYEENQKRVRDDILRICVPLFFEMERK